jgi:hypothetical protein
LAGEEGAPAGAKMWGSNLLELSSHVLVVGSKEWSYLVGSLYYDWG